MTPRILPTILFFGPFRDLSATTRQATNGMSANHAGSVPYALGVASGCHGSSANRTHQRAICVATNSHQVWTFRNHLTAAVTCRCITLLARGWLARERERSQVVLLDTTRRGESSPQHLGEADRSASSHAFPQYETLTGHINDQTNTTRQSNRNRPSPARSPTFRR
jgi:hypothetical protein